MRFTTLTFSLLAILFCSTEAILAQPNLPSGCCLIAVDNDETMGGGTIVIQIESRITGEGPEIEVQIPIAATDDQTALAIELALITNMYEIFDGTQTSSLISHGPAGEDDVITNCRVFEAGAGGPSCTRVGVQFITFPSAGVRLFDVVDLDYLDGGPSGDIEGNCGLGGPFANLGATIDSNNNQCAGGARDIAGADDAAASAALRACIPGAIATNASVGGGMLPAFVVPGDQSDPVTITGDSDLLAQVFDFIKISAIPLLSNWGLAAMIVLLLGSGTLLVSLRRQ